MPSGSEATPAPSCRAPNLHLLVYGLLNPALIVMRESDVPEYKPKYRVPLYPAVPLLGAFTSFGLIAFMDTIVP